MTLVHAGVGRHPFVWPQSDRCGDTLTFLIDVNGLGTGRDVPLVRKQLAEPCRAFPFHLSLKL